MSIGMIKLSTECRDKKSGLENLRNNDDAMPQCINFNPPFQHKKGLEKEPATMKNKQNWDKILKQCKQVGKKICTKQIETDLSCMLKDRWVLFIQALQSMAKNYVIYKVEVDEMPASKDQEMLGNTAIHCVFKSLNDNNPIFQC